MGLVALVFVSQIGPRRRATQIVEPVPPTVLIRVPVKAVQIFLGVGDILGVKGVIVTFRIKQHVVCRRAVITPHVIMAGSSFPDNFAAKMFFAKGRIQQEPQVMSGGGVAVQVQAAGGFQDAAQLDQPRGHHHQISQHIAAAQKLAKGGHHILDRRGGVRVQQDFLLKGAFRFLRPVPSIVKGADLGRGVLAGLFPEQDIVRGVGVKGRVEIDQVHRLVGKMFPHYLQVVAVVEGVGHKGRLGGGVWLSPGAL